MTDPVVSLLEHWDSFYVIIGSSAAALTGLQFVVIVLGAELGALRASALGPWATPTVVHFCSVLLISAIARAPWTSLLAVSVALTCCGIGGILYVVNVVRQAQRQSDYKPVLEDWLWHCLFPFIAYSVAAVSGVLVPWHAEGALFGIGGAVVALLFIGIHNAWDSVTYMAVEHNKKLDPSTSRERD